MNISDIIKNVGDENVFVQELLHDSAEVKINGNTGYIEFATRPDFATAIANLNGKPKWRGMVIWIPLER